MTTSNASFTTQDFARALRAGPYTVPGFYPRYFILDDGSALSFDAAKKSARHFCQAIREGSRDGWRIIGVDVNWEDADLYCEVSGDRIESAYAE
jgi:hypothetical protein